MVIDYFRVVCDAAPDWFLMENLADSPDVTTPSYVTQRFTLDASHVGSEQYRLRKFHFWHRSGTRELIIKRQFFLIVHTALFSPLSGQRTVSHLRSNDILAR